MLIWERPLDQRVLWRQIVDIASEGDSNVGLDTLEYVHIHKTAVLLESL